MAEDREHLFDLNHKTQYANEINDGLMAQKAERERLRKSGIHGIFNCHFNIKNLLKSKLGFSTCL